MDSSPTNTINLFNSLSPNTNPKAYNYLQIEYIN